MRSPRASGQAGPVPSASASLPARASRAARSSPVHPSAWPPSPSCTADSSRRPRRGPGCAPSVPDGPTATARRGRWWAYPPCAPPPAGLHTGLRVPPPVGASLCWASRPPRLIRWSLHRPDRRPDAAVCTLVALKSGRILPASRASHRPPFRAGPARATDVSEPGPRGHTIYAGSDGSCRGGACNDHPDVMKLPDRPLLVPSERHHPGRQTATHSG